MIIVAFLMLLVPGVISARIFWRGRYVGKSEYKYVVADYLTFSFLNLLSVFAILFITNTERTVSFSMNMQADSNIFAARFVFLYSATALVFAVMLPLVISLVVRLIRKRNSGLLKGLLGTLSKRPALRVLIALGLVALAIAASILIPRLYTAGHAPQILVVTPNEINQARNLLDEEDQVEVTIAGTFLSENTVIYANNLRIANAWEILSEVPPEGLKDPDIFEEELYGFDNGISFFLPQSLLEPGDIRIVAVNNADDVIPARSNSVTLQVMEIEFPEITSITATHLSNISTKLHIQGENFAENAVVLVDDSEIAAFSVHDEQNIFVYLCISDLELLLPTTETGNEAEEGEELPIQVRSPDETAIVVQNSVGISSTEYIVAGLPRIDATKTIEHNTDWIGAGDNIIANGMGSLDGWGSLTNTNSKEAFLHNYQQGIRLFEFRTQFSADGVLFGIHPGITSGLTFQQEQERVDYTLLTFQDVLELMVEYDDWWLVTNTGYQENLQVLQSSLDYMIRAINSVDNNLFDRMIVQAFSQVMYYFMVNNYPYFESFIYVAHDASISDEEVLEFAKKNDLPAVSMSAWRAERAEFIQELNEIVSASIVLIVNELGLIRSFFEIGLTGISTHFVYPEVLQMTEAEQDLYVQRVALEHNHREFIHYVEGLTPRLSENHKLIVSIGNLGNLRLPEEVTEAFEKLTSLETNRWRYMTNDGYLIIDGHQYTHRVGETEITVIIYDHTQRSILEFVVIEPRNLFQMTRIDISHYNNRRSFFEYMDNLLNENHIAIISVNEDASFGFDIGMQEVMSSLGLEKTIYGREGYSYIAIFDGHRILFESLSDARIDYFSTAGQWVIEVTSAGLPESIASIKINGVEHAQNLRGINIVVFNRLTGAVEDSVVFDTHIELAMIRESG